MFEAKEMEMADNNIVCQKNALKRGRECSLKGTVNYY
jgi:hypothetical protein